TSLISARSPRLTSILTSRFLMNLQQVNRGLTGSSRSITQVSEVVYQPRSSGNVNSFVGSMGAQLAFYRDQSEEDDTD
ncbi:hypothetical protein BD309DRAFT_813210, partial [Dichomitus squalens]